jgi:hypothetical protein
MHRHHLAWIETEFAPPAHRQGAAFDRSKILPYPQQRTVGADTLRKARDESRRRRAMSALREHLMQCAAREATLQHGIRLGVTERRPVRRICGYARFNPRNIVAQTRKRARMCAAHAPLSWSSRDQKVRDIRTDDRPECSLYVLI